MPLYYINRIAEPCGRHLMHRDGCARLPRALDRYLLGDFTNCLGALNEARRYFQAADGCPACANAAHGREDVQDAA